MPLANHRSKKAIAIAQYSFRSEKQKELIDNLKCPSFRAH
jgi:hypothetical protein